MNTLFYCNQKRPCKNSLFCGRECYMTMFEEYAANGVKYNDHIERYEPVIIPGVKPEPVNFNCGGDNT